MPIRLATKSDIPAMVDLLAELFLLEPDFHFQADIHARGFDLLMDSPMAKILVYESREGTIDGMVTFQPHISTAFGCQDAILEDLVVRKEKRSVGIGSKLLEGAEKFAWKTGFKRLRLSVDMENTPAQHFYESKGWKTGRMLNWYRVLREEPN
ncbi:MAG TPA: GNAT family N-acetyltransferase [Fibrobacteraceae bacterium]|nr:GNAT family N-acetyltransferase [Fibrobacteraceae bacterium]